jgi:hypothetical protein
LLKNRTRILPQLKNRNKIEGVAVIEAKAEDVTSALPQAIGEAILASTEFK